VFGAASTEGASRRSVSTGGRVAYREFTGTNGIAWRVWSVVPTIIERSVADGQERGVPHTSANIGVRPPFLSGWLSFEGGGEKRRLTPIPEGWETADVDQLERWCREATLVGKPRRLAE